MSDFSDRPFVAGSLFGLRAFKLDNLGRLIGPSFAQVFRPGENEAECRKRPEDAFSLTLRSMYSQPLTTWWVGGTAPQHGITCPCGCGSPIEAVMNSAAAMHSEKVKAEVEHVLGGVACTCGFYAYFDGHNDYKAPDNVAAVVEGYGVCTVGDRGFRASKARLVALVEPKRAVSPMLRDYLHRNYPDVPFYATKHEALTAHPLTPPGAAITPDDEDFWTREVPR